MVGVPTRKLADRRSRKGVKKHRPEIITVDLKDHVMGRAAAVIAKQLMLGRRINVVRCDELVIAGPEIRNKIRFQMFMNKRKASNPKKGPFHKRSPSDVFMRCIRGMVPNYTKRGKLALRRLVAYEGIPVNVTRKGARCVIPKAQRHTRLNSSRPFTKLGPMLIKMGWKYAPIVAKLEAARKEKATRRHEKMEPVRAAWKKANAGALKKVNAGNLATLKKFGYA
jgi:large subunit ribosomal protein L13Ae